MSMEASSCKCKSTPPGGRMGNMNRHAPCCSTVKYAILNTMDNSWTNDTLQNKFCDRALRFSDISHVKAGRITDTVIITHSMAGLVMSMAMATGKCNFGKGSTWVALSSPMTGSMASDYFQDFCSDELNAAYVTAQKAYRENSMMLVAADVIPHKSPQNDGLVEFQSCAKGLEKSKFGSSYKDTFYKPQLNHADTVFLTSDGWFKDSQKPAKWFECLL
ncbi:uncharacterized protein PITG_20883 [Phytophthora infestans T30-4]|uniref:Uncharacterized protein n=1 Tax=Phytophthora infestans (strain T30-4) TaxID=403677 RepID=D0P243_PHYIT|nr:uncharacterized protein PITG_20883 [Phytophthora infestans T30-4]EEY55469.1 conserved hypothetical protein [Phytophthora infestans T30-4]|eukprot:XP_002895631.1 conserved hypothetical protein [Phytophthora infestans T30-4]